MSAAVVDLQSQVESVLGTLVKTATVDLIKLFESRYRAAAVDVGRTEDNKGKEPEVMLDSLSCGDTKRSIGVQVDEDMYRLVELSGPTLLTDDGCLRGCREVVLEEGCPIPSEILLAGDNGHVEPVSEVVAETVDMVEISIFDPESVTESDATTEIVLHVSAETLTDSPRCGSTESSPAKQKPLVIRPDTSDATSGQKVKFVCPLLLKPESPALKHDNPEKPVRAEPQQAEPGSTAKGTAYSPSPSDGAVTPAQVGVWERIHTPKETKNHLQMKLKLASPDQKLLRPCAVQLVNVLTVPESEMKIQGEAASVNHNTGWPQPKDLRRHQGPHTGHRLCCFTQCESGIWRLQKVVLHSRDGYACSICDKSFKRRKILRRHERFHTGEKPYSCSQCSSTFALRKSLRRHLRFHTGERPHTCSQCGKSFRLRENLKAHSRFHTGEKPFSCAVCGKMFRILRNLEKHKLSLCEAFVPSFKMIAGL
ncbi:uncharacterized protein [Brachyistius frenatus]|uniref:uncharacterized protein n=1 Tax=Brachyistius frenatus TaxID=100188 RepID=UPI0037E859EA